MTIRFKYLLFGLCLLFPLSVLNADELDDAFLSNVYGAGSNIGIGFGVTPDSSILYLEGEIPLSPMIRLSPQMVGMFSPGGDILLGGGIQLYFGAPPSREKVRFYGGPLVHVSGFTKSLNLYSGGSGGVEFFTNQLISFSLEAGGGFQLSLLTLDGYTQFFISGKFSVFFPFT